VFVGAGSLELDIEENRCGRNLGLERIGHL
jgi:hypothetical protein